MGNIFISVLGLNQYQEVAYSLDGQVYPPCAYVQIPILKMLQSRFTQRDLVLFLGTPDAMEKQRGALESYLKSLDLAAPVDWQVIPQGVSENELLKIFEIVVERIQANAAVYFDITHGFRSLPMTIMAMLPFLQVVKEVKVQAIYYGMFPNKQPDQQETSEVAPILNLAIFGRLIEWSMAASHMVKAGNGDFARQLARQELAPYVQEQYEEKNRQAEARKLKDLASKLGDYTDSAQVSHAVKLPQLVTWLQHCFDEVSGIADTGVFGVLVDRIKGDLLPVLSADSELVYFYVAEWCHKHGLIQQSVTILQEGLLSFLMFALNFSEAESRKRENREEIQKALNAFWYDSERAGSGKWPELKHRSKEEACGVFEKYKTLVVYWKPLTDIRNSLNHAGMSESPTKPDTLKQNYQELLSAVMNFVHGAQGAATGA